MWENGHHVWQVVPGTKNTVREKVFGEINAGKKQKLPLNLFHHSFYFILFFYFILHVQTAKSF